MEEILKPLAIVLVVVVILAAIIGSAYLNVRRRDELKALAHRLGLHFDASKDPTHDERYSQFAIFRKGHSRRAYNTIEGERTIRGRRVHVRMGDFLYKETSSSGKSSQTTTYRFSYQVLHLPYLTPKVAVRREHLFDKLAGAIGFDDIDFESAEFSRTFHVSGEDKRFVYDLIHPRMMEFLLRTRPPTFELALGCCCISNRSACWSTHHFEPHLQWAEHFLELWPDHLVHDLESRTR